MKILIVEDRGSVAIQMKHVLEQRGHEVLKAVSINDAQSFWEAGSIDCLIVDLNMSPVGLEPAEIKETKSGLLTGWVWLKQRVYSDNPAMKQCTIIYTEYLDSLEEHVPESEWAVIERIRKKGSTSPGELVLNAVARIAALPDCRSSED